MEGRNSHMREPNSSFSKTALSARSTSVIYELLSVQWRDFENRSTFDV